VTSTIFVRWKRALLTPVAGVVAVAVAVATLAVAGAVLLAHIAAPTGHHPVSIQWLVQQPPNVLRWEAPARCQ
jgi:hypothetical protein